MDKSRVLTLVGVTYSFDEIGNEVPQEKKRNVFCNITGVSANEWFEAGNVGITPEYRVTMFSYDYQNEQIAELNGIRYGIYRTYLKNNEDIELYLERKVGVNGDTSK